MDVGIFYESDAEEAAREVLKGFATGVRMAGDRLRVSKIEQYVDCDVAVMFGLYKKKFPHTKPRRRIWNQHRSQGKPVLVLDSGYVKRDVYFSAGWNGLNGMAEIQSVDLPPDRWELLDTPLRQQVRTGSHVLVIGQVPWDASCQHASITKWCRKTVAELRDRTSRPVIFRPHPMVDHPYRYRVKGVLLSARTLAEDFQNCHVVVTFNSNTGVDAIIAGIPVLSMDPGSMVYRITDHDLSWIDYPNFPGYEVQRSWAANLAYRQWNVEEFRSGLAWQYLRKYITERVHAQ
jgi:hypothetical protein